MAMAHKFYLNTYFLFKPMHSPYSFSTLGSKAGVFFRLSTLPDLGRASLGLLGVCSGRPSEGLYSWVTSLSCLICNKNLM